MSVNTPACAPEIVSVVAAEVERQIGGFRDEVEAKLAQLRERTVDDRAALVVFSNDLDRVLAAFVIATGAAAAGLETSMFFTFWGLTALKKKGAASGAKSVAERVFAALTPASSETLGTSKMNLLGAGALLLRRMMREKEIASLEDLMRAARDLGVRMIACTMSMDAMGLGKEELLDGLEYGGVATYVADAARSRVTLFI
jgi:peroxiredoxin family protein